MTRQTDRQSFAERTLAELIATRSAAIAKGHDDMARKWSAERQSIARYLSDARRFIGAGQRNRSAAIAQAKAIARRDLANAKNGARIRLAAHNFIEWTESHV